jgi:hypothetical protein
MLSNPHRDDCDPKGDVDEERHGAKDASQCDASGMRRHVAVKMRQAENGSEIDNYIYIYKLKLFLSIYIYIYLQLFIYAWLVVLMPGANPTIVSYVQCQRCKNFHFHE